MQQVDEEDEDDDEEEQERVVVNRQGAVGELPPSESESEDSDEEGATAKSSGDKVGRPIYNKIMIIILHSFIARVLFNMRKSL